MSNKGSTMESSGIDASLQKVRSEIARHGAKFDLALNDEMRLLYDGLLDVAPAAIEKLDLAYGTHARHRLDLFSAGGKNLPVLLYVHGGGFTGGDKRATDRFYANVGRYFASKGFLAATMNYRLASTDAWPAGREDVAAAVNWLSQNAESHGGSARIGLIGQSSGCCHVAAYALDRQVESKVDDSVRALALLSGYYKVKPPLSPGQRDYFGTDAARYDERSPSLHVSSNARPLMLTVAEYDPAPIAQQTLDYASALAASRGACPEVHWLAGHNHVSSVLSLGSLQTDVSDLLLGFFRKHLSV
jgi:triacylglycerol lipase